MKTELKTAARPRTFGEQAELLSAHSHDVKRAIAGECRMVLVSMGRLLNLRVWTREFPWTLTGLSAGAAFLAANTLGPRRKKNESGKVDSTDGQNGSKDSDTSVPWHLARLGRRVVEGMVVTLITGAVSSALASSKDDSPPDEGS